MNKILLAILVLAATPFARAQDDMAERQRIAMEIAAAEARFAEQRRECNARFAVSDCVRKATREKNAVVGNLRRQERALDDAERRRRAAARLEAQQERNSPERLQQEEERRAKALEDHRERQGRAAEKAARQAAIEQKGTQATVPGAPATPAPQGEPRAPRTATGPQITPEEAARNRAAHEERLREAREHEAEVRKRLAERKKPPAPGLPVPP